VPYTADAGLPWPIKDCSDAGGVIGASDPVALVQPHGKEVALRDYADPVHPRTVCRFSFAAVVQLIDSRHIVVMGTAASSLFAVVDLPEMRHHWFQLRPEGPRAECTDLLGVSPGLDAVTWRTYNIASGSQSIHVTTAAGDRVVGTLPSPDFCGSFPLTPSSAYSPSGQYMFFLDRQAGPSMNSLLVLNGSQVRIKLTPPKGGWAIGAEPSMPVWSPVTDTLYYEQDGKIWSWTSATGPRTFLPGLAWCYPTLSADGRYLAYGVLRADGLYQVDLLEMRSGQAPLVVGKGTHNMPAFLNSNLLWYQTWSYAQCGAGVNASEFPVPNIPPKLTGQPVIYDTTDGSETPSLIDQVFEVWPATGYGYSGAWPPVTVFGGGGTA
jgi:hypothetical protein